MLRILLISDTHGNLDVINEIVSQIEADMVIHAGDFGFYDDESVKHLSPRELRLLIVHSPYGRQYSLPKDARPEALIPIIQEHKLLGSFSDYIAGEKKFIKPVYAVWGNHEDLFVLKKIRSNLSIENLNILDENNHYEINDGDQFAFRLFGIGGNFLKSKKLFDKPLAGKNGKVWSTLHEYGALYQQMKKKNQRSIFVSHVSPGKEALLVRLISHFLPNLWLSGHMGAPYSCVWNEFTVREYSESLSVLNNALAEFSDLEQYQNLLTVEAKIAYDLIKNDLPRENQWFRNMWNINLSDAKDGYAILEFDNDQFNLTTKSIIGVES